MELIFILILLFFIGYVVAANRTSTDKTPVQTGLKYAGYGFLWLWVIPLVLFGVLFLATL